MEEKIGGMKLWIITMSILSAIGASLHFIVGEDTMWQFLSGFLFGAPLSALFFRVSILRDILKEKN